MSPLNKLMKPQTPIAFNKTLKSFKNSKSDTLKFYAHPIYLNKTLVHVSFSPVKDHTPIENSNNSNRANIL